jgi:hypothetical protein
LATIRELRAPLASAPRFDLKTAVADYSNRLRAMDRSLRRVRSALSSHHLPDHLIDQPGVHPAFAEGAITDRKPKER